MKKFLLSTFSVLPILCVTAFASPLSGLFPKGLSTENILMYGFLGGIGIALFGALFLCIAFLKPSSRKESPIESPFDVYLQEDSQEDDAAESQDTFEEDAAVDFDELPESDLPEETVDDSVAEADIEANPASEIVEDPASEVEKDSESNMKADTEPDAEVDSEAEPNIEIEPESEPDAEVVSEVEAEPVPDVEPEEIEDETVYPKLILTNTTTNDFVILPLYPETTVGRKTDSDLVLSDVTISGLHCKILNEDGSIYVIDENSTNGTFINGERISEKTELRHGDKLLIGKQEFNVSMNE